MAEKINQIDAALQEAFESIDQQAAIAKADSTGMEWLPGWYTRRAGELTDTKARATATLQAILKQIEAEEKAFKYRHGEANRAEIDRQFKESIGGKLKYISHPFG